MLLACLCDMNLIHALIKICDFEETTLFFEQVCNGAENCKDASDER